jgi:hypothetical protein
MEAIVRERKRFHHAVQAYMHARNLGGLRHAYHLFDSLVGPYSHMKHDGKIERQEFHEILHYAEFLSELISAYFSTQRKRTRAAHHSLRKAKQFYNGNLLRRPKVRHTLYISHLLHQLEKELHDQSKRH